MYLSGNFVWVSLLPLGKSTHGHRTNVSGYFHAETHALHHLQSYHVVTAREYGAKYFFFWAIYARCSLALRVARGRMLHRVDERQVS